MPTRRDVLRSAGALAGGLALGGAVGTASYLWRRPSVLLICVDAMRADRLGAVRGEHRLTPFMDTVAARGVTFADTVASSSWTKTAVASLLTGLHPFIHSVLDPEDALPAQAMPLPRVLSEEGYVTVGIQTNPWLGQPRHGFDGGYDLFRFLSHNKTKEKRIHVPGTADFAYVSGDAVAKLAETCAPGIARMGRPFFAYFHLMDAHSPCLPPAPYDELFSKRDSGGIDDVTLAKGAEKADWSAVPKEDPSRRRLVDLYNGAVKYADDIVRRIVEAFETHGLLKRTVLVVCSDHGEELWEHGRYGHAQALYEESLKSVLVMAGPGLAAGAVVRERARQVDIAPTILDLAGVKPRRRLDGSSLVAAAHGMQRAPDECVNLAFLGKVYHIPRRAMTTLAPHLKVIESMTPGARQIELYNLRSDPAERKDIASANATLADDRLSRFNAIIATAAGRAVAGAKAEIDDETRARLRALGYLQ